MYGIENTKFFLINCSKNQGLCEVFGPIQILQLLAEISFIIRKNIVCFPERFVSFLKRLCYDVYFDLFRKCVSMKGI